MSSMLVRSANRWSTSAHLPRAAPLSLATQPTQPGQTHVMKFGGSSVGSADAMKKVGSVLEKKLENGDRVVGVMSAMFGVTNRLVEAADAAAVRDVARVKHHRQAVYQLHEKAVNELFGSSSVSSVVMDYINYTFQIKFDEYVANIAEKNICEASDMDVVSSMGERLSTQLISAYLTHTRGLKAPQIEADDIIVTDSVSGDATPLLDLTARRVEKVVKPLIVEGALPIFTGFIGADVHGKTTTLGRGGSDLTAAVVGHALDADEISLWKVEYTTDEDGWMKDWQPGWVGVVHDADTTMTIPELAYEEAAELAHFGKKVLHPQTVGPAVEKGIPIRVGNTMDPQLPGTLIKKAADNYAVHAITKIDVETYEKKNRVKVETTGLDRDKSAIVTMVGVNVNLVDSLASRVVDVLGRHNIPCVVPDTVNGSDNNFSVVIPEELKKSAVSLLHEDLGVSDAKLEVAQ